jgi:hypothetical protein
VESSDPKKGELKTEVGKSSCQKKKELRPSPKTRRQAAPTSRPTLEWKNMPLFGIKNRRSGGSVKGDRGDGAGKPEETILHSSCRQLPVAVPDPEAAERAMFRRRLNRPRIPLVIHCEESSKTSLSPVVEKKKSPSILPKRKKDKQGLQWTEEEASLACLKLLESDCYADNRVGMEQLMVIVNRELVNSKQKNSVAEALLYPAEEDEFSCRLRVVFPSFFKDEFLSRKNSSQRHLLTKKDNETQESESTDETSFYSDLSDTTGKRYRRSLKLPALRVLISCLELVSRKPERKSLDISERFWHCILAYMVSSLEESNIERLECALCVKGLRLLSKSGSPAFEPYSSDFVSKMIVTTKEYGLETGDKILVRECDRFLKLSSC